MPHLPDDTAWSIALVRWLIDVLQALLTQLLAKSKEVSHFII
jgi:hypothetical protein